MIRILLTCILLLSFTFPSQGQSSSKKTLETQLKKAKTSQDKMTLNYELGKAYLKSGSKKKAEDYAYKAALLAREVGDREMAAKSYFINAQAKLKNRDRKGARTRFNTSFDYAKKTDNVALILEILPALVEIEKKYSNHKAAYQHTADALQILKDTKGSIASPISTPTPASSYGAGTAALRAEKDALQSQKRQLEADIMELRRAKAAFSTDQSSLTEEQKKLAQEKSNIEAQKSLIEAGKERVEATLAAKEARINRMSKKQLVAETKLLEKQKALDHLKMKKQEQDLTLLKTREQYGYLLLASALGLLLTLFFFLRARSNRKAKKVLLEKNKLIEDERERSDELLKNILPANIAEELKEHGKAKACRYEHATVMFSDFKNFTKISEQLSPEQLVQELDDCFRGFDLIISQYKLEKIKTIGDAYMVADGLNERKNIPLNIIKAALDMQEFLEDTKQAKMQQGLPYFEARIGIHTGPVVAGVVGLNKFAYDIWGDTVNIAARMEANCEAGQINISEETYRLVKYNFNCLYRGKISAKNKGQIDMYYVESRVNKSVPSFV